MATKQEKPKVQEVQEAPELEADPLAQDIGAVDTSFPILSAGLYDMEITDAVVGPAKSNPANQVLTLTLKTTADGPDIKGEIVNKGFPVYHRVGLTPTEDYPSTKIIKNLAAIGQRCGLTGSVRSLVDNPEQFKGHIVRVKLGIQKETEEYPSSNTVKAFIDVKGQAA